MNHDRTLALAVAAVLCGAVSAQSVHLNATAGVSVGLGTAMPADFAVSGPPQAPYVLLVDFVPGPGLLMGRPVQLGVSSGLTLLAADFLGQFGAGGTSVNVPPVPQLAGLTIYSQALVVTTAAPNGLFVPSNGESTILYGTSQALVERFDFPLANGFTGNFDPNSVGEVRGRFVLRQVQPVDNGDVLEVPTSDTVPAHASTFFTGIQTPLDPRGCRAQFVYRAGDLGANGTPEVLRRAWWRVADNQGVFHDVFQQVAIRVGHTTVQPDFSIDSWSALPAYPTSGLSAVFSNNESSAPVQVRNGAYSIDPGQLVLGLDRSGLGRYLDWGIEPGFVYNGTDNLLLDVRTEPSPTSLGLNGAQVYLTVLSDYLPAARSIARAMLPIGTIDPDAVTVAAQRDNAIHDMVFEFARVEATAQSPFRSGGPNPDYQPAILAARTPGQSYVEVRFRGADDAAGSNATPFSLDVNVADGKAYLQYSIKLVADVVTGEVPSVDTLVVPVQ
ncbi:MAG: hypothetical protein H6835_15270 [Planctomycetes bacterium]|nr:hypothetical protein [Planctomycetota bacterium]